jgi:hypothetical protein
MVTNWGGEKVAQRTELVSVTLMLQAMFFVGDRNAPFLVADDNGAATTRVNVALTCSYVHEGGGPITKTSSTNVYVPAWV